MLRLAIFVLALIGLSSAAFAEETPDSRIRIALNMFVQTSTTTVSQTVAFEKFSEEGSRTANYEIGRRPVIDIGGTVRLKRGFGAGVSLSYFHDPGSAQVSALIPHPFFFNRLRPVSGEAGVSHGELGIHLQAVYWIQRSKRMDIVVSGGPSIIRANQGFVTDVVFSQTPPYDTATFRGASVSRLNKTATGGNVGVEVGWRLSRHFAVAASSRFSRATAEFSITDTPPVAVHVGGFQAGGGLRLLF